VTDPSEANLHRAGDVMSLKDYEPNKVPKFKIKAEHLVELERIANNRGITVEEAIEQAFDQWLKKNQRKPN
jgi:hypothetical protein